MLNLKKISRNKYKLSRFGKMNADVTVYANDKLVSSIQNDEGLNQLVESAKLSGVVSPLVGMPDIHQGYGLPIGGVMACKSRGFGEVGMVSAGAVGYDINCGVRLLRSGIKYNPQKMDKPFLRNLMTVIENKVPTGTGKESVRGELRDLFEEIALKGSPYAIKKGFGRNEDIESTEEGGCMEGASLEYVSDKAKKRGKKQLATLGGGNHFIEIQLVDQIFDEEISEDFGLHKGNLAFMIHTGSRGFGHQIAGDFINQFDSYARHHDIYVPCKGLAAVPIDSGKGEEYIASMSAAVNYAFANRQLIMHFVREAVEEVMEEGEGKLGLDLVYDVAHNIAKFEPYENEKEILIHRKGATRALPAGHKLNPAKYMDTGHPVIVPGDMGRASFVLVGLKKAKETYFSVNHGAGRILSRTKAKKTITKEEFEKSMGDVLYNARDFRQIADEAPLAYKNIFDVVDTLIESNLAKKIIKLKPLAVVKGLN